MGADVAADAAEPFQPLDDGIRQPSKAWNAGSAKRRNRRHGHVLERVDDRPRLPFARVRGHPSLAPARTRTERTGSTGQTDSHAPQPLQSTGSTTGLESNPSLTTVIAP